MKINLSRAQYKQLIEMVAMTNGIVAVMGDMLSDTDYKKRSDKMSTLEEYLLQFAKEFGCEELMQMEGDKAVLDDEYYEDTIQPIITDYEEFATEDTLANKLAWRDFRNEHTKEELDALEKENGGYFGVSIYKYEEKYWKEFEEYGYSRLKIDAGEGI